MKELEILFKQIESNIDNLELNFKNSIEKLREYNRKLLNTVEFSVKNGIEVKEEAAPVPEKLIDFGPPTIGLMYIKIYDILLQNQQFKLSNTDKIIFSIMRFSSNKLFIASLLNKSMASIKCSISKLNSVGLLIENKPNTRFDTGPFSIIPIKLVTYLANDLDAIMIYWRCYNLASKGTFEISDKLKNKINLQEQTIRKKLKFLEELGLIKRTSRNFTTIKVYDYEEIINVTNEKISL